MSDSDQKRLALFNRGAEALRRFTGETHDVYACPLCLTAHGRDSLIDKSLTLEHVPPKSQGGKGLVLTCAQCNRTAGHTIDAALHARSEMKAFADAVSGRATEMKERKGKAEIGGTRLNVGLSFEGGGWVFRIRGNHPGDMDAVRDHLDGLVERGSWEGERIGFTVTLPHKPRLAAIGDLKTAFLVAFARLGYRYAASPQLEPIRQQILRPHDDIVTGFKVGMRDPSTSAWTLSILEQPFIGLFVQMGSSAVLLPWETGGDQLYDNVRALTSKGSGGTFSGSEVGWPDRMSMDLDFNLS